MAEASGWEAKDDEENPEETTAEASGWEAKDHQEKPEATKTGGAQLQHTARAEQTPTDPWKSP